MSKPTLHLDDEIIYKARIKKLNLCGKPFIYGEGKHKIT